MKSFREYMTEETMPYANVRSGEMDVGNSAVRDQINQLLAGVTHGKFITPYVALERVAKALANFHIFIPNQHFLEGDSGTMMWPVNQYGFKSGMTDQGEFVVSGGTEKDETHGAHMGGEGAYIATAPQEDEYSIYFEYRQTDCGMFMVFCELVTKEELDEIMDDLEAELDDEGPEGDDDEEGLVMAEEVYHSSYTSAIQTAVAAAKKRGYEVDQDDYHSKVASGPRKPSEGKTVSHNIKLMKDGKPTKKGLAIQVYNRGGDKTPYELNHYISEETKDDPPFEPTGSTTNAKTPRNVAKRLAQKAMKQAKEKAANKK